MVFARYTTQINAPISPSSLAADLRAAIAKAGVLPISEFTAVRPSTNATQSIHLVYPTPVSNVSLILSVRSATPLLVDQTLGLGWDDATKRATNYTRDALVEGLSTSVGLTIDVLKNNTALIIALRQGTYSGIYGYFVGEKADWWDTTKHPLVFQFAGRNSEAIIGFDGTLNPYGQTTNYNSSDSLTTLTPAGVRDVVPNFFLTPNAGGSIASRAGGDLAKACTAGTTAGDSVAKGTEEYLILTNGINSGIAARIN